MVVRDRHLRSARGAKSFRYYRVMVRSGSCTKAQAVAGAASDKGLREGSCARRFVGAAEETSTAKVMRRVERQGNMEITSRGLTWTLEVNA